MPDAAQILLPAVLIGMGATVVMDLWAAVRKRLMGVPTPDYGLVGRWLSRVARGHFRHDPAAAARPVTGERVIGWVAHYLTGIAFASVLVAVWGPDWVRRPTIGPALLVGIVSVAAPFLIMQPGMGLGIAASHAPQPASARGRSLVTHAIFGVGLYIAAWLLSGLFAHVE